LVDISRQQASRSYPPHSLSVKHTSPSSTCKACPGATLGSARRHSFSSLVVAMYIAVAVLLKMWRHSHSFHRFPSRAVLSCVNLTAFPYILQPRCRRRDLIFCCTCVPFVSSHPSLRLLLSSFPLSSLTSFPSLVDHTRDSSLLYSRNQSFAGCTTRTTRHHQATNSQTRTSERPQPPNDAAFNNRNPNNAPHVLL